MVRSDFLLIAHCHISIFSALFEIIFCDLILDIGPASIKFRPNFINSLQNLSKVLTLFVLLDRIGGSNQMTLVIILQFFTLNLMLVTKIAENCGLRFKLLIICQQIFCITIFLNNFKVC